MGGRGKRWEVGLLPLNARPPPPNALPHQLQMSPEGPLPTFCLHVENPKTHLVLLLAFAVKKEGRPPSDGNYSKYIAPERQ